MSELTKEQIEAAKTRAHERLWPPVNNSDIVALCDLALEAIAAREAEPVAWQYMSHYDGRIELFPNNALWKEHGYAERHPDAVPLYASPVPPQPTRRGEHVRSKLDDFEGTVVGEYLTLEGKTGLVIQHDGKKFCHIYGEQWVEPAPPQYGGSFTPGCARWQAQVRHLQGHPHRGI